MTVYRASCLQSFCTFRFPVKWTPASSVFYARRNTMMAQFKFWLIGGVHPEKAWQNVKGTQKDGRNITFWCSVLARLLFFHDTRMAYWTSRFVLPRRNDAVMQTMLKKSDTCIVPSFCQLLVAFSSSYPSSVEVSVWQDAWQTELPCAQYFCVRLPRDSSISSWP